MTTDETNTDDGDEANNLFDDPEGALEGATDRDDARDASAAGDEGRDDEAADRAGGRLPSGDGADYLKWAAFVLLGLIAAIALFRFYFAASRTIDIWISRDFVPMFQAAFNLVVLLAAGAGLAKLARHIG